MSHRIYVNVRLAFIVCAHVRMYYIYRHGNLTIFFSSHHKHTCFIHIYLNSFLCVCLCCSPLCAHGCVFVCHFSAQWQNLTSHSFNNHQMSVRTHARTYSKQHIDVFSCVIFIYLELKSSIYYVYVPLFAATALFRWLLLLLWSLVIVVNG